MISNGHSYCIHKNGRVFGYPTSPAVCLPDLLFGLYILVRPGIGLMVTRDHTCIIRGLYSSESNDCHTWTITYGRTGETKTDVVVRPVRPVPIAIRRTDVMRPVVPRAATLHPVGA